MRAAVPHDRLLLVYAEGGRDPLLDDYIAVMAGHGHECAELEAPAGHPAGARELVRAQADVRAGAVQGIVVFGREVQPFKFVPRADSGPLPDYSDLPFGSDFAAFDVADGAVLSAAEFAEALQASAEPFTQSQWVSRVFRLDRQYLDNLRDTVPPQVQNMLIVNSDENASEPKIMTKWRSDYRLLTNGQNARFAFRGTDFATKELLPFLQQNLANATFVSITDHGMSTNLENMPGLVDGAPQLPAMPDVVELAACATGRWMDDADNPQVHGLAETALARGALAVIAPQCLLAWNFAKGVVGRPAAYDPNMDRFVQDVHNVAPWLDCWPVQGSLGRAQAWSVTENLSFLKESAYIDKGYICHHVLCGHSLFGDGTVEFASR